MTSAANNPPSVLNSRTGGQTLNHPQDTARTPELNPQRTLSFSPHVTTQRFAPGLPPPPTLSIPAFPSNPDGVTPPHRTPLRSASPFGSDTPNLRKPPLPPQTPPLRQNSGGQLSGTRDSVRTLSFEIVPEEKELEEAGDEGIASRGRRHSWDPSMTNPPRRLHPSPQSRTRRSSFSESPPSGGAATPGATTPLRRAASAAPSLSPILRSAANSSSPSGTPDSQYVPASRLKSRKNSWSENDFRAATEDISPEEGGRRSSFPSPNRLLRGGSAESMLKVKLTPPGVRSNWPKTPGSHTLDFSDGADFSPKTTEARKVASAGKLRKGRWRLTTVLGLFAVLLMLTSLLTHFWAVTKVGPQLETMAANLREGFGGVSNDPPVQCVRNSEGGSLACYVPAEEKQLQRDRRVQKRTRARLMYERLLAMAAHSLAELEWKPDAHGPWAETPANGTWEICADQRGRNWVPPPLEGESNGYLLVSVEGGINQQRVAVCNAVALARHLNLTLVLPEFIPQNGVADGSQFEDIFSADHFKEYLRPDVRIVDRLPSELSELNLANTGSVFDDSDFPREAPLRLYEETLLPVLRTNRVVHLRQFVNRLAFDPIPPEIQKLRCRVNFHALRFQPRIQAMGRLLIDRMRSSSSEYNSYRSRKTSQADSSESVTSNELVGVAFGAEKRPRRRVLQTEEGVKRLGAQMAGRTTSLERDDQQESLVEDPEVDRNNGIIGLLEGAVESRGKGQLKSGVAVEGTWGGGNALETTSGANVEESSGTESVWNTGSRGRPVESRDEEVLVGTRGGGKRRLLAEDVGADDDISHLPEAVQRYMRNQRLRDERKRKQQEQSARAGARPGRELGKDETLTVLERDEGMEVVHVETALVLGDDTKGLAERTRVAPAVGEEITVADPEKPGRRAGSGKPGERLGVSVDVERSRYEEEERWPVRFVALHANFPAKLAAFSMCDFGGGEEERKELRRLREAQFEALARWERNGKAPDPKTQRKTGQCPLTPEEAVLMLAALGVKRRTRIYLTTAEVWGGADRLVPLRGLYPYFVTKEQLASPEELAPFTGSRAKLAALDFIVASAADLFAMTDPGSQLSSLVTGMRMFHGRGKLPTLRPDKRQLAAALADHKDVEWHVFANKVGDSVRGSLGQTARKDGQSIYRHSRSPACMQFHPASPPVSPEPVIEERAKVRTGSPEDPLIDPGQEIERIEDEVMLAVELHARNSTLSNGTSSFEAFEVLQKAVEPIPTSQSAGEVLERD
ncbi:O-fucosyltransferase family protein [Klebsormidium nitens]|uniref:O-fucosyltransferase family protein n=1 Tax=Klebsormidium nitens TaxID=105231 RepID=A0A1Y1IKB3_KLENI|nr:O-fucosyltransferase family protein [Klebsormidium nitens]|eukprot:GAQ89206.1 O-fucosyltransferase family protein [Klebsormidium nitens]